MTLTYGTDEWLQAYDDVVKERAAATSPPYIMGTPEWIAVFEKELMNDAKYKDVAKTWEGSVTIHILPKPEIGVIDDLFIFMDTWHGETRFVRIVPSEIGEAGDFVITGEYEVWKSVLSKELDPIKAMMTGKLKLRGDLPTMVKSVKSTQRMVEIVASVDARFPDELSVDEIADIRQFFEDTREEFGI